MRILGHGIDLVSVSRIRAILEKDGEHFESRVFSPGERAYCHARFDPMPHFAARFAAKEAYGKSLGLGLGPSGEFAEIEVDVDTGQVTVTKLVMAVDCGVAINPVTASGQIEGGMLQALGYGHSEEFAFDADGRMVNTEFDSYRIYRADEMPAMEVYLVQTMEDSGPFGAKAVAEIPKDGVAPALRSAILNATGVAIDEIPFTPERVWRALNRTAS